MSVRLRADARGMGAAAALVAILVARPSGQSPPPLPIPTDTLARVSRYVESYYTRAQSLMVEETVMVQPVRSDLAPDGFARFLIYDLRFEWKPGGDNEKPRVDIVRELLRANRRPAKPGDEPKCLDPRSVSPEPLAFLLPDRRDKFTFASAGVGRFDGRSAVMVDYRSVKPEPPTATIDEKDKDCIMFDLPGRSRGRVWADPE